VRCVFFITAAVLGAQGVAMAEASVTSPTVATWSHDLLHGQRAQVLAKIEANLRSSSPDPSAGRIWTDLQRQGVPLDIANAAVQDKSLKAALGALPLLSAAYDERRIGQFDSLAAAAGSALNPDELLLVAIRQNHDGQRTLAVKAIVEAMRRAPATFRFARWAAKEAQHRQFSIELLRQLAEKPLPGDSPAHLYLKSEVRDSPIDDPEQAAHIRDWAGYAQDPDALFALGEHAYTMDRFDEARKYYQQSLELYPFEISRHRSLARALIRLGRMEEGRIAISAGINVLAPLTLTTEEEARLWWVRALIDAGELGKAREELAQVAGAAAQSPRYWRTLAYLERESGRGTAAAAALKKLGDRADFEEQIHIVVDSTQHGDGLAEAFVALDALRADRERTSPWLEQVGQTTLARLKRHEQRRSWLERATRDYPDNTTLLSAYVETLATLGRCSELIPIAERAFSASFHAKPVIAGYLGCKAAGQGANARAELLAQLRKTYPGAREVWEVAASAYPSGAAGQADQLALLEQARSLNPHQDWPVAQMIQIYVDQQAWTAALAVIEAARASATASTASFRAAMDRMEIWATDQQAKRTGIDAVAQARVMGLLDQQDARGESLWWVFLHRSTVHAAAGRKVEASESLLKAFELRPDNWDVGFDCVTKHYQPAGIGRAMRAAYHYLERNPYDGKRLRNLAQINAMWHPNPVETLRLQSLLKERAPEYAHEGYEGMALGKLGAYVEDYQRRYGKKGVCNCKSSRYVGWFDAARKKAQSGKSNTILARDYERGTATLRLPSGQVVTRGWHRYGGGAASLIRVGNYSIRSTLDDHGRITRVEDSGKRFVEISYDAAGQIKRISRHDGKQLDITYGATGKPERLDFPGVGTLQVTYQANGEVDKVDAGTGGARIAALISSTMGELTSMASMGGSEDILSLPALAGLEAKPDPTFAAYLKAARQARLSTAHRIVFLEQALKAARVLVLNTKENVGNASRAREILEEIHDTVEHAGAEREAVLGAQGVELLHMLFTAERPDGLSGADWNEWNFRHDWLAEKSRTMPKVRAYLANLDRKPLKLLPPAQWLPSSKLSSEGFWRAHPDRRLETASAVLVRANLDIVVGTQRGLLVFRRGHWTAYAYEPIERKFSAAADYTEGGQASNILSVAEDPSANRLWVGTARGLFAIDGDYDTLPARWLTQEDGLPDPYVRALAAAPGQVYVLTQGALVTSDGKGAFKRVSGLSGTDIVTLRAGPSGAPAAQESWAIAAGSTGVWRLGAGNAVLLDQVAAGDALIVGNSVYALHGEQLVSFPLLSAGPQAGIAIPLADQQNIAKSKKIHGLSVLQMDDGTSAVAVMTDLGLSIYHDGHFESLKVPLVTQIAGVTKMASQLDQTVVLTSEGVFAIERQQALQDVEGRVFDLLTDDDKGLTYVARGHMLQVVDHKQAARGARAFDHIAATMLARDAQGRLVANDGQRIVRYEHGAAEPAVLFEVSHQGKDKQADPDIDMRSLLVSRDGTIWVAAGASLYRWRDGMATAQEFGTYVNQADFPAPTSMVSRVLETREGKILVICSDERHLIHRGTELSGGVLEWDGTRFIRHPLSDKSSDWFITSYTPIDGDRAIVGTAGDFAEDRATGYASLATSNNASYQRVRGQVPTSLGTRGAKLGDDTWLFGSTGGVLAYRQGTWFYPARLNWMLPEDYKFASQYGVRVVHAVATDKSGRIYAGTDRGLLIYDSGGGDSASFLISSGNVDILIAGAEDDRMGEQLRILLAGMDPANPLAKLARQVLSAKQDAEKFTGTHAGDSAQGARLARPDPAPASLSATGMASAQAAPAAPGLADIQMKKQRYLELLLRLKKDSPGLYDAMQVEPLALARLRSKLRDDQVILQYLPTGNTLFIHVLTRSDAKVVRVEGTQRIELFERAERSWLRMAEGRVSGATTQALASINKPDLPALKNDLSWLYDNLLRPVEGDLEGKAAVFVVAGGALSHLPFGALIRHDGETPQYAVQRYVLGYLPSLFLFEKLDERKHSASSSLIVFADPDGTLSAAGHEARAIVEAFKGGSPPYIGANASLENFNRTAPGAGTLHLATHGSLDPQNPERSYLLFAGGKRLAVADAMALPLQANDLVVLSACETGIGGNGMEYLNLAYAFSYAGASSLVATLWRVPDGASANLMRAFYANLLRGDDRYTALAHAQRTMISSAGKEPNLRAWAGFLPFGRP
jgi:YD repeat-containing protein